MAAATIVLRERHGSAPVDDTLTVSVPLHRADAWDQLAIGNASAGDYANTFHAGGTDWPLTVTVP